MEHIRISRNNLIVMGILFTAYIVIDVLLFDFGTEEFYFMLVIQILLAGLSIIPVGTYIIRFLYGSRTIKLPNDKAYLTPIFNDVYGRVKSEHPKVSKNIKLYIDNSDMSVNAYALGGNSITITRGAIENLSDDELKGVIGHEFGHIIHGDTFLSLFLLLGNSIFLVSLFVGFIAKTTMNVMVAFFPRNQGYRLMRWLLITIFSIPLFVIQILLMMNSRTNEYKADKYAYEIGLGNHLYLALNQLSKYSSHEKTTIMERIKSSHPDISNRIARLSNM